MEVWIVALGIALLVAPTAGADTFTRARHHRRRDQEPH
jgi:hypothetical protein